MSHDESMSETNGNRPPIDPELISAFFDAETTLEERAVVEESMEDGGATLQRLDEYDQLSQSLKQLHRAAGSPDLKASVMAQIQPPTRVASPAMAKPRRRMLSIVAGLTGMAAAVTLLMWPRYDAQHENMLAVNDTAYEHTSAERADALSMSGKLPAPAVEAAAGAAMAEAGRIPAPAAAEPMSAGEMARMEADLAPSLLEMTSERTLPEVGDVVGYLDENANELTWVAVTVVDVQKAGDQVQLLLTRHGVASPEAAESVPESPPALDRQVTFVVEADWAQMEAVIVDLTNSAFVNSLRVNAPQEDGVPKELQGYIVERGTDPSDDRLAGNEQAEQLKQRVEGRRKPASDSGTGASAKLVDGGRNDAVQLQLLVPHTELKRIAARRGADPALAAGQPNVPAEYAPAIADADDTEGKPETQDEAEAPVREGVAGRIGRPLASRRAKAVFVIQQQNR